MPVNFIVRIVVAVALAAGCSAALAQVSGQSNGQPTRAEVEANNKKIAADNDLVMRNFTAGNEALKSNRLDEAINAFRGGLRVRPDEPALLTNLSEALRLRGSTSWNEALKATDSTAKTRLMDGAKKDWVAAATSAQKALQIINELSADPQMKSFHAQNKIAATTIRARTMKLVATKVDQTQARAAFDAYMDYIAVVSDPAQKSKLKGEALEILLETASFDEAILRSRAVLREEPQHLEATRILGMALFGSGDEANARIYLQRYVRRAPDTDPYKSVAQDALKLLEP